MEAKDLEKEILGSLAGYVVTVCLFLAAIYVLDIIKGELFYSLLIGFFGGVALTGWLWGREKTGWLAEKDELEGRLAEMAELVEEYETEPEEAETEPQDHDQRPDTTL